MSGFPEVKYAFPSFVLGRPSSKTGEVPRGTTLSRAVITSQQQRRQRKNRTRLDYD